LKKTQNKLIFQILAIIIITASFIILFFFPDLIENKYPYSYINIQDKKAEIETLNGDLTANEITIMDSMSRLDNLEKEKQEKEEKMFEIKKKINQSDFELDIPSILISLEQNANQNEVDLTIGYNLISHSGEPMPGGTEDPTLEDPNLEQPNENVSVEEQEEDSENSNPENEVFDMENSPQAEQIPGISITTIPISISGSYSNVRKYIKYLDEVGMIEPSSVKLSSEGRTLKGQVTLNVFHGEVQL